jgi:hypothetical protein
MVVGVRPFVEEILPVPQQVKVTGPGLVPHTPKARGRFANIRLFIRVVIYKKPSFCPPASDSYSQPVRKVGFLGCSPRYRR